MGLKLSPSLFERFVESVLKGLQHTEMFVYLDDVVVPSKSLSDHDRRVRLLLKRLRYAELVLQPEKVQFLRRQATFLGHSVSANI